MHNRRNFYRILHIQPDAPGPVIKSSYRTLMQTLKQHPDLGGEDWNAAVINEAYKILSDPLRREEYDKTLMQLGVTPGFARSDQATPPNRPETTPGNHHNSKSLCIFCTTEIPDYVSGDPGALCATCKSPIYPVELIRTENTSKRAVHRVHLQKTLKVYTEWPTITVVQGVLQDFSPNGLLFACSSAINPKRIIKIDCDSFAAVGQVVNRMNRNAPGKHRHLVGVRFLTLRFEQSRGTFVSARA